MDAAVRGKDATRRRVAVRRESAPAFRESDRERGTDTTRWNVDAALAIEECGMDRGEALFPFRRPRDTSAHKRQSRVAATSYNPGRPVKQTGDGCRTCSKGKR
jgi:hypothetical protein